MRLQRSHDNGAREEREESSPSARARLLRAIASAQRYLLSIQAEDGHWCGELEGDTILESEYILVMCFLGRGDDPRLPKAAEHIRRQQLAEGGWAIFPGGPPEVSASVKAYLVLKLLGDDPGAPHMCRARRAILALGGVEACNSFTKIYLSIFGQYSWERAPAVPPEMILLPRWFYFNIYEMSSWSRAIVVPLSIIWAHKPFCPLPEHARIQELFRDELPRSGPAFEAEKPRLWRTFFATLDRGLKLAEAVPLHRPLRRLAVAQAEAWVLERLRMSDGLAAIFPPIINSLVAFRCLGYGVDHPVVRQQMEELDKLVIEEEDTVRLQPCFSAVWDTALTLNALLESGLPRDHPALLRAARWLLDREVRHEGDWRVRNPEAEVGGWYFEYANEFYPDCDDTVQVLTALSKVEFPDPVEQRRCRQAMERGVRWQLSMQNADGGWGAFDKGCEKVILTYVPFADHNAMIDPSTADVTGRALEGMVSAGLPSHHPAMQRAASFLRREQEIDGTWYGRWGTNYIYGTWLALRGLKFAGENLGVARYRRAFSWLAGRQNEDGGWGESLLSYDDPSHKGRGESTAAQTAWALLALLTGGDNHRETLERGIRFLLEGQRRDGSWYDEHWTGTGFPRVFYLRYHLYAVYFPLLALATWEREMARPARRTAA